MALAPANGKQMPLEKLGPYRLEKLLGRGGMGAVYVGVNEVTGERAAVKVLAGHLSDNVDFRERFVAEVETLKKLKHPNIVQLLAYGEEDEHLFYVMELVDGHSLQDELQAGRRFDWREVAKIGVDICRALKHAHDSGVIHRDLKPANLLLDQHNQVKLTDFGIAKLYGGTQITAAGGILGTADYMSPEQAEGKPVNARSDLYSIGSVLYALLAGRPPFAAKSLAEVIHGLRFDKPIPVRRLAPDTPEQFESIILQLLEKEPSKRIASAFALANYLRAMDHALSMETQVGQIPPAEPAQEGPATPLTRVTKGVEATVVAHDPNLIAPTMVSSSATAQARPIAEGQAPRVSGAEIVTVVPREGTKVASATASSGTAVLEEPVSPKARFVTVEEEEAIRRKRQRRDDDGPPLWLLLCGMGLVACLLAGFAIYALLPPSAHALYGDISEAAEPGDLEQLRGAKAEIDQFLARFPDDPRAAEVQSLRDRLDVDARERQFHRKARFGGADAMYPVERAYLDALRLAETDPERALARFQAIVAVFQNHSPESDEEKRAASTSVELAKKQVERLREAIAESSQSERALIESRLDQADKLKEDSPAEASEIYRGIIELYGDKAWAKDLLARARDALSDSP